jgi:FAD/FMN-containing dehydrogenase
VTADGCQVRTDADHEPELFWALHGGGGAFGVVTALELRLVPTPEVYAGVLWWPIEREHEVLHAWAELTRNEPTDDLTTVGRYLRLPPAPHIPEPIRGRSFVVVEVVDLGDPEQADELLIPLRALEPELDTIRRIPAPELTHMNMDPDQPVPATGTRLDPALQAAITEIVTSRNVTCRTSQPRLGLRRPKWRRDISGAISVELIVRPAANSRWKSWRRHSS